jgi:hypothetical protein
MFHRFFQVCLAGHMRSYVAGSYDHLFKNVCYFVPKLVEETLFLEGFAPYALVGHAIRKTFEVESSAMAEAELGMARSNVSTLKPPNKYSTVHYHPPPNPVEK